MEVWQEAALTTALVLAVMFALADLLRRVLPPLRAAQLPGSILAGGLALAVGPEFLAIVPLSTSVLEFVVYHGLALVFIAVALTPPPERTDGAAAQSGLSMGFGIVVMIASQTALGLGLVLVLSMLSGPLHPGIGLLLPLGFEQGPGQAMAMGGAWEPELDAGRQLGLIMAAAGFAWSVFVWVPLVAIGRARGWVTAPTPVQVVLGPEDGRVASPGAVDRLTEQWVLVAVCYAVTLGVCTGLSMLIAYLDPQIGRMVWGFHFIIGAMVATLSRSLLVRFGQRHVLDGPLLARTAGAAVDVTTASALAAVQVAVLAANWVPVLVITTVGGIGTLVLCLWFAKRAFRTSKFEHSVVWFGMSTGTLPMGLALLRVIDPDLRSPAPMSAVVGSAMSTLGAIPIVLLLHPAIVKTWPDSFPGVTSALLAVVVAYLVGVIVAWRYFGGLRFPGSATWVNDVEAK